MANDHGYTNWETKTIIEWFDESFDSWLEDKHDRFETENEAADWAGNMVHGMVYETGTEHDGFVKDVLDEFLVRVDWHDVVDTISDQREDRFGYMSKLGKCRECREWIEDDEAWAEDSRSPGEHYCESCNDNISLRCASCEGLVQYAVGPDDWDGDYVCPDCNDDGVEPGDVQAVVESDDAK